MVLAVEDLQFADEGFLDFLESILDWSAKYPILILTLSRPELVDLRPAWGQRRGVTTINLEPLDAASMASLLSDLVEDLPSDLVNRIVNPLRRGAPLRGRDDPQPGRPRSGPAARWQLPPGRRSGPAPGARPR